MWDGYTHINQLFSIVFILESFLLFHKGLFMTQLHKICLTVVVMSETAKKVCGQGCR